MEERAVASELNKVFQELKIKPSKELIALFVAVLKRVPESGKSRNQLL